MKKYNLSFLDKMTKDEALTFYYASLEKIKGIKVRNLKRNPKAKK